ncbi:MAG: AAA family ATPase [Rothia sp. (in: high G+C Gram-positive bacteria)]|nr:AAA family ATPase [Rothia sp. (in: high G+C Gram-positive bacteria)]
MYYPRFIEPKILEYLDSVPVVIVEGARSVGKTSMMRELHQQGKLKAIYSLTDPQLRSVIAQDILGWLRGLPMPCCIDEAQLLPELPNAIKALMDERQDQISLVLTGSASIGQTSLGGSDALAGRAIRVSLAPLSEAELVGQVGQPWSVIDYLFDETPMVGQKKESITSSLPTWSEISQRGGLPHYRVPAVPQADLVFSQRVIQDISSVLTRDVLPGERFDKQRALDVLTYFLRNPSGEVNLSNVAKSSGLDSRTVTGYLNRIEERFLLWELPNFHTPVKKSARTGAKCYPLDIALSLNILRSGDTATAVHHVAGGLFEAHVAQQLRAHIGWSRLDVTQSHWRQPTLSRNAEVDIVLKDGQGRLVGIEVKTSTRLKADHLKGLRSLKAAYADDFHRGFLVAQVDEVQPLGEDLWVIPVEALYSAEFWDVARNESEEHQTENFVVAEESEKPVALEDAQIFMSYTHEDQASVVGGDMRQFARDIQDTLEGVYGREVKLFIDTENGTWGEDLWSRLENELLTSTFLLPFITPRYVKSEACRREFTRFAELTQRAGASQLLLPLIWMTPPALRKGEHGDPLIDLLTRTRYVDATAVRRADRSSAEYSNAVEDIAGKIDQIIEQMETTPVEEADDESEVAELGFADYMAEIEENQPVVVENIQRFMMDFTNLGATFQKESEKVLAGGNLTPVQVRGALTRIAKSLEPLNEKLEDSSAAAAKSWTELMGNLNHAIALYQQTNGEPIDASLIESVQSVRNELMNLETQELEGIAQQMPKVSAQMKPTSRALLNTITTIRSMQESATSWLEAVGAE